MTYEPPIKNYSYPYSTNTEIGWPWCDDNSNNIVDPSNLFSYLPKCQCKNGNVSAINNEEIANNALIDDDNKNSNINSQQFLRNERLIEKIQKHGSDKYKLRNPMRWWGGCIESLP